MKNLWKLMTWLVVLGFMTAGVYSPVMAASQVDQNAECTINLTNLGGDNPVSGGAFVAYRVATIEAQGGQEVFRSLYGDKGVVDIENNVTKLASEYYTMVSEKAVEEPTAQVAAEEGKLTFSKLKPGLYLIVQETSIDGYNNMTPFLISVPTWDKETKSYVYTRTAVVKNDISSTETTTEEDTDDEDDTVDDDETSDNEDDYSGDNDDDSSSSRDTLPQTGQLWWPLPLLLCAGLILMLVGRKIRR